MSRLAPLEPLVRITLKKAYTDGTVAVDMDPLSLLCRLATSVPAPRLHTVRYAGVLAAARAKDRPRRARTVRFDFPIGPESEWQCAAGGLERGQMSNGPAPRRIVLAALLIVGGAVGRARPQAPPAQPPSPQAFPVQVELVKLEVTVLDGQNRPAPGLRPGDFVVLEDGVAQEIASFEAIGGPGEPSAAPGSSAGGELAAPGPGTARATPLPSWTYVVFVDDLHLTPSQATDVRKAVATFLDAAPAGSRIVLIATGTRIVEDRVLPQGRDLLRRRTEAVRGSLETGRMDELLTDQEAYDIFVRHDPVVEDAVVRRLMRFERPDDVSDRDPFGEQRSASLRGVVEVRNRAAKRYEGMTRRTRVTLGTLRNALDWLSRVKGRRSVVLASGGFLHDPAVTEFEDVLRASLRANVAVSFLDARGLRSRSPFESAEYGPALDVEGVAQAVASEWSGTSGAESLALNSGGLIIHHANDLTRGLQKITDAARTYYLVGFQSSNARRDGRFRRLSVGLRDRAPGRTVLGRRGYYAPRD